MSIKRVPLFGKKNKKTIKRADERREGTLPVFCIPSSSLWASLMCLPQSLFWLPPAVSFSPLHWRGFWLTKIKHELLGFLLATLNTDHRCASFPALYTHQGCASIGGKKIMHQQCKYYLKDIWKLQELSDLSMHCGPGADYHPAMDGQSWSWVCA